MAKFFQCKECNKQLFFLNESKSACSSAAFSEIEAGVVEASYEKHIPAIMKNENGILNVQVGSVEHPMIEAHFIEWIFVELENGKSQIKKLVPNEKPEASFTIGSDKLIAVYAYCNLHGLWKVEF